MPKKYKRNPKAEEPPFIVILIFAGIVGILVKKAVDG